MLLSQIHQHLVLDIASANNSHIFTEVHSLVKAHNHFTCDLVDVVDLSQNRQAHHVIFVDVKVYVLHQGFKVVIVCGLQLLPNSILLCLHMKLLVLAVAKHIAQHIDCVRHIVLKREHMIQSEFS